MYDPGVKEAAHRQAVKSMATKYPLNELVSARYPYKSEAVPMHTCALSRPLPAPTTFGLRLLAKSVSQPQLHIDTSRRHEGTEYLSLEDFHGARTALSCPLTSEHTWPLDRDD